MLDSYHITHCRANWIITSGFPWTNQWWPVHFTTSTGWEIQLWGGFLIWIFHHGFLMNHWFSTGHFVLQSFADVPHGTLFNLGLFQVPILVSHQYWWAPLIYCHFSRRLEKKCCRCNVFWWQPTGFSALSWMVAGPSGCLQEGRFLVQIRRPLVQGEHSGCMCFLHLPHRLLHFYLLLHVLRFIPIFQVSGMGTFCVNERQWMFWQQRTHVVVQSSWYRWVGCKVSLAPQLQPESGTMSHLVQLSFQATWHKVIPVPTCMEPPGPSQTSVRRWLLIFIPIFFSSSSPWWTIINLYLKHIVYHQWIIAKSYV